MSFFAFDREFTLTLSSNDSLVRKLDTSSRIAIAGVRLWRGQLMGVPDSWVRLTTRGSYVAGTIWDGTQLYRLEPYRNYFRDRRQHVSVVNDRIMIFPDSDTESNFRDLLVVPDADTAPITTALEPPVAMALAMPASPGWQMDVGVVADAARTARFGEETAVTMLAEMNSADGLLVQQLGVHINVAEVVILDESTDPFTATEPDVLLEEFSAFKQSSPELAALDLAHLFSSEQYSVPGGIELLGIANLGGVCDAQSAVTLTTAGGGHGNVIAHELGHSLGAPHDGEAGSPCADTPQVYLMAPLLPSGHITGNEFSQCSIDQMLEKIANVDCLEPIPQGDLSLSISDYSSRILGNREFSVTLTLDNPGFDDAYAVELEIDSPLTIIRDIRRTGLTGVDCRLSQQPVLCTLHSFPSGLSQPFTIYQSSTTAGPIEFNAQLRAINDGNPDNNSISLSLDVLPAVTLRIADLTTSLEVARPGERVTVSMTLLNEGIVDATEVVLEMSQSLDHFALESVDLPGGAECMDDFISEMLCPIGDLPMNLPVSAVFNFFALDTDSPGGTAYGESVRFSLTAAQEDTNRNNHYHAHLQNTRIIADAQLTLDGPSQVAENDTAEFVMTAENLGPDEIEEMRLYFSSPGLLIDSYQSGSNTCNVEYDSTRLYCEIGPTAAGDSVVVVASGTVTEVGTFTAGAALYPSAYPVTRRSNDLHHTWTASPETVAPPPATGSDEEPPPGNNVGSGGSGSPGAGSGGGGPVGLFWLAALAIAGILRMGRDGVSRQD